MYKKNSNRYIFTSVYQIDMKFDRQLRLATCTTLLVSYGGKTILRWRTTAILNIVISPYLSEKSSHFDELLYTAAGFEHHVAFVYLSCEVRCKPHRSHLQTLVL